MAKECRLIVWLSIQTFNVKSAKGKKQYLKVNQWSTTSTGKCGSAFNEISCFGKLLAIHVKLCQYVDVCSLGRHGKLSDMGFQRLACFVRLLQMMIQSCQHQWHLTVALSVLCNLFKRINCLQIQTLPSKKRHRSILSHGFTLSLDNAK